MAFVCLILNVYPVTINIKFEQKGVLMLRQIDSMILRPFAEGLVLDQYIDPFIDIGDITIGSLLNEDSAFKDVPIITIGRLLQKTGITIQRAFEIKNQLVFYKVFNS